MAEEETETPAEEEEINRWEDEGGTVYPEEEKSPPEDQ